ncbi:MAG: hypothetical protein GY679_04685, partial [Mycoplasma sp.]|nr:hypothetical protein [Mycoplasma sp.]
MSIDNADLKDIKDLPSAGTPTRTMSLASQQASVSDIAQRTTVADLALDGNPINASDVDYRFITPKDFN